VRKTKEKKQEPVDFAVNAGIGALIALGFAIFILFIASLFVVSGRLPEGWMGMTTVLVLFVSSLLGALYAIRRNRARALFVGVSQGAMLYAITFLGGFLVGTPTLLGQWRPLLFIAAILGGVAAGLLSMRPKKRKL